MNRFQWFDARSMAEATSAAREGSTPKAGGIDLLDLMKEGLLSPKRIVNLRSVPELGLVAESADGSLRIGATVTLAQLARHPLVRERYRALAQAAAQSASPQIRNVATLGGNLLQRPRCWYFRSQHHHCVRKGGEACFAFAGENQYHAVFGHDGCAIVHPSTAATALVGGAEGRRSGALEAFFLRPDQDIERENDLKPGEILTAVVLPPAKAGVRSMHLRQGELDSFDWPIADVAAVVELDASGVCRKASIILGAAAPVPWRAKEAEAALTGKRISEDVARTAARAAIAGASPLSKNAYKLPVFEALVRRALLAA